MILKGERQLQARFKAIGKTDGIVRSILVRGAAYAKDNTRSFRKTGNLGATIRVGVVRKDGGDIRAGGTSKVGYAGGIERGTGLYGPAHRKIVPKKAKVLAWRTGGPSVQRLSGRSRVVKGKQVAGWAFARSVRGRRATPYLRPGLQRAVNEQGIQAVVELWNGAA